MRNKETGEFELVVGDRQLLSGFFIGVLLLAVVFALGYELGQNSPRSAKLPAEAVTTNTGAPNRPQPAPPEAKPDVPAAATSPDQTPGATAASGGGASALPQPTVDASAGAATAPPATQPATATAPPDSSGAAPVDLDPNASYVQVTAQASRSSAEAVMKTLKDSGFPAILRPGPNNLTAVWVGPYMDRKSLAEAKGKLEKAGFNTLIKRP